MLAVKMSQDTGQTLESQGQKVTQYLYLLADLIQVSVVFYLKVL